MQLKKVVAALSGKKLILRIAASLAALCVTLASIGLVEFDQPAQGVSGGSGPAQGVSGGGGTGLDAAGLFGDLAAPSGGLDIKAEAVDGNNCVAADAGFLLTLTEPLKEKYIRQWLKTSPEFDYALKKTGALEYKLTPKQAFEKNTLYTLRFDPLQTDNGMPVRAGNSWAFQTRKGFAIERTFPMDQGTGVPVNSVIELTFTGDVKLEDLRKNVSFTPKLGGSDWRRTGMNTYAFLATGGPMEPDTVYEVRVKGALAGALGGETLGKDCTFKFRTEEGEKNFWSSVNYENNAFMTTERPAFSLWFHPQHGGDKIAAKVFRFESPDAYAKAVDDSLNYDSWGGQAQPTLDTSALPKILDDELALLGDDGRGIVVLPQALPKGFYAVEFTTNERTLTNLFQVTDLSAYAMSGGGDSLFWVNGLTTSLPMQGAEITRVGGASMGRTGADGVLTFKTPDSDSRYTAYWAQNGGDRLLVMLYGRERDAGFNGLDYWKYVYCDRRLYGPEDTVKFFGVVSPKLPGTKAIDKVTMVVEENYWDRTESSEIRAEVPVKNGVYEGEIRLPELAPGYYCLSLYSGEERLGSTYFEVMIYRKPAYSLKLTVDKPIIWADGHATATATASYFEGTPVAQLDLVLDGESVKTDGFGVASAKVGASIESNRLVSWRGVNAEAELPEIGRVYESTYVQCVNSDVEIETHAKRDRESSAGTLEVQAFAVDFTGLDSIEWYGERKHLKDFGGSLPLTVSWTKITYPKVVEGTEKRYDPYTKTYTEVTRYSSGYPVGKLEGTKTFTVTGKDKQSFPLPLATEEEYRINIKGKDTKGREFTRTDHIYAGSAREYTYDYGKTLYVRDNNGKNAYAVGDKVSLSAYENYDADNPIEMDAGAVLFLRASDVLLDCTVSKENLLEFTFDGEILPNINVHGVLFDGREYVEQYYPRSIVVDAESRALNLEVTPDKASYRPGETAALGLKLTGPDGQPVQGTVNLNMVDEALLALREQYADIADIFWDTYSFYPSTAVSHIIVRLTGGGEKGDGEGEGDRSDFRDTALFKTVETDSNGLASVEVKLPDNITSWRLFWQAFRPGDVMAGSGRANLIVTLPFFVDIRLGNTFLTGDKPILGIRNAGTALKDGQVKYTVEIPSLKFKQTANAPISAWHEMPLPALKAGEHAISVAGEYNGLTDKITTKFTVVEGIADHMENQTVILANSTKFDIPAKGTAHLTFADKQKAQVMHGLWGILGTSSIRAEQLIAKQAAQEVLAAITPEGRGWFYGTDYAEKIPQYQRANGSIAPFTYGDVDDIDTLATTAWACAAGVNSVAACEYFSKPAAAQYLYGQLSGDYSALALMGLAALREPVMQHISELAQSDALTTEDSIYLALAQVFIGNGSAARGLVREIVNKACSKAGETLYVDAVSREDTIRRTANLSVAAVLLDLPEGGPLFQYVLENRGYEDLYLLQQLLALRHRAQSVNPDCASFTCTLDGKDRQVKLFLSHSVLLTVEQLKNIRFSDISDEIEVTASYLTPGFPTGNNAAVSVSQKYDDPILAPYGSAYVKINFTIDAAAPDGYYNIVHVLPAGLEFTGCMSWRVWVSEVKGQQVTFTVHKSEYAEDRDFVFTARRVMTGSFRSEGTYITNTSKPEFTNSVEGGVVTIK